ncbi:lysylphosphatidylglycerol synthase transmembrane domain-containing protein [Corynebacterium epidermidicanis]|uniref:Putative integral membrane protein n=1 Tax=Corynebacterium epidermidicanis TaxID=1050174 RepID=A0A0G3GXB6_9CORY|nr:YbhN family protein [Corynebacterium epidermidicanis]AKK04148.1 putative integral membrane protein [Corynebacterium epidermidicanis]
MTRTPARSHAVLPRVLRAVFSLAVLAALAWFFKNNMPMVRQAWDAVTSADPEFVGLAVMLVLLSMFAMAEVMYQLMRAGGVDVRRRQAQALTFSANSWANTLPGGPALSTVLQFRVQRSWGASVIVISWFVLLSGAVSTMWLVVLGLGSIVFLGASLSLYSLIGAGIAMALLAGAVHWASVHPLTLEKWTLYALPLINRLRRKPAHYGETEIAAHIRQLDAVRLAPGRFAWVALLSLVNRALDLATLWCCIVAVTSNAPLWPAGDSGTDLAGVTLAYATAKIVGATGITPGGIGPVEAALTATLAGVGMTAGSALAAALVYRLVSFILLTLVGWIIYAIGLKEKQ